MGVWDLNFVQRPDSVTGLQRRVGSYINEFKAYLQERINKEHEYEVTDGVPQVNHGIHREGSGKAYVTDSASTTDPTDRPTGGGEPAIPLDSVGELDRGRLLVENERKLKFWKGSGSGWIPLDLSLIGSIVLWPGVAIPDNWFLCNGQSLAYASYLELYAVIGVTYGGTALVNFKVPNLQGLIPQGKGQQTVNGRTKGYTSALGTVIEDRLQTMSGHITMHPIYSDSNMLINYSGIFEPGPGGSSTRRLDRAGGDRGSKGFQINLTTGGIRHGAFNNPNIMQMNYIIKAE
jgi:hypothetical protein